MHDVKVWLEPDLYRDMTKEGFADHLRNSVASALSFEVWDEVGHADNWVIVAPNEVDITLVAEIAYPNRSTSVVVEIAAYDFPERVSNINERLGQIGRDFKEWLVLHDRQKVSLTFIPVPVGCWAIV